MPWFQIRRELNYGDILALLANFALYGGLSGRVMSVAAGLGPTQEIYSIDECLIDGLEGMRGDLTIRADAVPSRASMASSAVTSPCSMRDSVVLFA